jgi:hypothetical protein
MTLSLGIIIGVFSVVVLPLLDNEQQIVFLNRINSLGTNLLYITWSKKFWNVRNISGGNRNIFLMEHSDLIWKNKWCCKCCPTHIRIKTVVYGSANECNIYGVTPFFMKQSKMLPSNNEHL